MSPAAETKRVSAEARAQKVREEVQGLFTMVHTAESEEEWREIGRRAGAIQRRARMLGGLGKGG